MGLTKEAYFRLVSLYNCKKSEITRKELCLILGISETNYLSYKEIINIIEFNKIGYATDGFGNERLVKLDRGKLEDFIRQTEYFLKTEEFIHKSNKIAIT